MSTGGVGDCHSKEAMSVHLYAGIGRPATVKRGLESGLARPLAIVC